jgi:hypothetical protein
LRGTVGDRKGLVKIPRIFLAQPRFTSLTVLDKSALYGRGIPPARGESTKASSLALLLYIEIGW